MKRLLLIVAMLLLAAPPASAGGIANVTVSGNSAAVTVSLPLGLGADLTLSFDNVVGLSAANLGLSAQAVSLASPALLARLPADTAPGLGLLVRIEPPATGGLSFSGLATLDLHTHNLPFLAPCPLRLFSAPLGGPFADITASIGAGSYRARGNTGGFSEFLIVTDGRPVNSVIETKFDRLEQLLDDHDAALPAWLVNQLTQELAASRADYAQGAIEDAIAGVDAFASTVQQHSGATIPNVWRSARDVVNVGGLLRAAALTLRFSLGLRGESRP